MGGPRLEFAWRRDGMDIVHGMMGVGTITHTIMSASNNDVGNYTCHASIDSEEVEYIILVEGNIAFI